MNLEKLTHTPDDPWEWRRADFVDVDAICDLTRHYFESEIEGIFTPDEERYRYHLSQAILTQLHNPQQEFLIVAYTGDLLLAYAWITRGSFTTYAPEEMAEARMSHICMDLPLRTRLRLQAQIIQQWELWARVANVPVLVSTSIREDQRGFMRLHQEMGFRVRGSYAYKNLTL